MSRAASDQLTTPSRNIYVTQVKQADGTLRPVMSSQALSDQSVRINSVREDKIKKGENLVIERYKMSGAVSLLIGLCLHLNNVVPKDRLMGRVISYRQIPISIWASILEFNFGLSQHYVNPLVAVGNYAVAIRRPSSIFQQIDMDPAIVVDAAMRGQEDIVLNILRADPSYLLKPAEVENSVGVKSIRTPLQAAIMANDIQLIERMKEHFERIPNGLTIMYEQMLTIYKESLRQYYDKQQAIVDQLTPLQENRTATSGDLAALTLANARAACYLRALRNIGNPNCDDPNYLNVIIAAHDQAQIDNTFDFKLYAEAICSMDPNDSQLQDVMALINARTPDETAAVIARTGVSPTQTDAARAKYFDQLTLVEKLNRFREELIKHMRQEMIFNPHHILEGLRQNDRIWDEVAANRIADPNNYAKRTVIFSQLVGWAQRNAAEPVKQDIRQGTHYLTEQNEARTRQSRLNDFDARYNVVRNSLADVSLLDSSVVDGIGYKFAGLGVLPGCGVAGAPAERFVFKTYVKQKHQAFTACYAAGTSMHPQV